MTLKRLAIAVFMLALFIPGSAYAEKQSLGGRLALQIIESLPWEKSNIEVSEISIPGVEEAGDYDDARVRVPASMAKVGKASFPVSFFRDGIETKTLWATAQIKVYKQAVVALKPLKANRVIRKSDVKLSRVDVRDTQDSLFSIDEVAGMVARRPITAGSVIKKDYIKPEILVKRGENVVVSVESDSIRIRSKGTATEDGYRGRYISVRTGSGREVLGRVIGPGEIAIEF